jgi:addiction module RelE/StbE family toxin
MKLIKDENYQRKERKFFKQHPDLLNKYAEVLGKLKTNAQDPSLKTLKLKGSLSEFYSCSLSYEYRIICLFLIKDDAIVLVDIGSHDDVY